MNPIEFVKTLYFGDGYCTGFIVNQQKKRIEIHTNGIIRLRGKECEKKFQFNEFIDNGIVIIASVEKIIEDKSGLVFNDEIYNISVNELENSIYEFLIEGTHVYQDESMPGYYHGRYEQLEYKVLAREIYLIDPKQPDKKIIN